VRVINFESPLSDSLVLKAFAGISEPQWRIAEEEQEAHRLHTFSEAVIQ